MNENNEQNVYRDPKTNEIIGYNRVEHLNPFSFFKRMWRKVAFALS